MKYESVRMLALAVAVGMVTLICVASPAAVQAESLPNRERGVFDSGA